MNLFDIKIKRQEILEDGSLYLEFQPKNQELEYLVMHTEQVLSFESISHVIEELIPGVRDILFNSLPEEVQLNYINTQFRINDSIEDPSIIDYNILGLHKKRTIIKGELIQIDYYKNFNPVSSEYSDIVVREERVFNRNGIGLVQYRELKISWYLNNGDIGLQKSTIKYYSPTESIDEGRIRRENIIIEAKLYVLNAVGQSNGFVILNELKAQIDLYMDGLRQPLIDGVSSLNEPFLTEQDKNNIIEILTF
jgi:hypothetical protein